MAQRRNPRRAFLAEATAIVANPPATASGLGRSRRVLRAARNAPLPRLLPRWAIDVMNLNNRIWNEFYHNRLTNQVFPLRGDPRDGNEGSTVVYFHELITPVLENINNSAQVNHHFAIVDRVAVRINQPQPPPIDVSGHCGFVITRDGVPFCAVELKKHYNTTRVFRQGRDQALIYAAAIGLERGHPPMLAIVTDLERWQFLRVTAVNHKRSDTYIMGYNQAGMPAEASTRRTLSRVQRFLRQGNR